MKQHLFLEGDMRLGKSQIIRQALLAYGEKSGGFFVQRIFVGDRYQAFTLNSLEEMEGYVLEKHLHNLSEVEPFLYCTGNRWEFQKEIFMKTALQALKRARAGGKRIILMDEIGGVELASPEFVNLLMEILNGEISCLGVLKSSRNAGKMDQKLSVKRRSSEREEVLEQIKKHPQVGLLQVTRENLKDASLQVNSFVRGCMDAGGKSLVTGTD